jgi:hypothetical protein
MEVGPFETIKLPATSKVTDPELFVTALKELAGAIFQKWHFFIDIVT